MGEHKLAVKSEGRLSFSIRSKNSGHWWDIDLYGELLISHLSLPWMSSRYRQTRRAAKPGKVLNNAGR